MFVCAAGATSPHVRGLLPEQAEVRVHRHRVRELLRGNASLPVYVTTASESILIFLSYNMLYGGYALYRPLTEPVCLSAGDPA